MVIENTMKMLQIIINGQSAMKSELLGEIQQVEKKLKKDSKS